MPAKTLIGLFVAIFLVVAALPVWGELPLAKPPEAPQTHDLTREHGIFDADYMARARNEFQKHHRTRSAHAVDRWWFVFLELAVIFILVLGYRYLHLRANGGPIGDLPLECYLKLRLAPRWGLR